MAHNLGCLTAGWTKREPFQSLLAWQAATVARNPGRAGLGSCRRGPQILASSVEPSTPWRRAVVRREQIWFSSQMVSARTC